MNSFEWPGKPSSDLICPLAIVIAAAEVKPAVTGMEINWTRNPAKQQEAESVRKATQMHYYTTLNVFEEQLNRAAAFE